MLRHIVSYFARRSRSRALAHELGAMSDRELADIGISRCDIPFVIRQSYDAEAEAAQSHGSSSTLGGAFAGSRLA